MNTCRYFEGILHTIYGAIDKQERLDLGRFSISSRDRSKWYIYELGQEYFMRRGGELQPFPSISAALRRLMTLEEDILQGFGAEGGAL